MQGFLSVLIWLPIAAGILVLLMGDRNIRAARWVALLASIVTLLISLPLLAHFNSGTPEFQFVEHLPWITRFHANYALGVDGAVRTESRRTQPPIGLPIPNPFPQPRRGPVQFPPITGGGGGGGGTWTRTTGERVNPEALREVTDDTGGRTEIVRGFGDLQAATARLADELSKQYSLAYSSTEDRDGRWHAIRVEVRDRRLTVRARRGYMASTS